jgi:hypothetical protein
MDLHLIHHRVHQTHQNHHILQVIVLQGQKDKDHQIHHQIVAILEAQLILIKVGMKN